MALNSWGPSLQHVPTTNKNPAANMGERVRQTLDNLLQVYKLEDYKFPCRNPWSNILASTLGAIPGQRVYGHDMLCSLAFKANWRHLRTQESANQRLKPAQKCKANLTQI